ncbi:MAG: hypothetical protein ACIAQ0_13255, partial [Phycisphaerales bacterium JB058]
MSNRRKESDQSRRQFLGNAAATAGGASLFAAGCASTGGRRPGGRGAVKTVPTIEKLPPVAVKDN